MAFSENVQKSFEEWMDAEFPDWRAEFSQSTTYKLRRTYEAAYVEGLEAEVERPPQPFLPEGWTFDDHGNGVVYVRAPSGKHAAIGYMAPGDMVLSGILHELVATILTANAAAT